MGYYVLTQYLVAISKMNTSDSITQIITHSNRNNMSRYFVQWISGEKSWIEEEDMNCPKLLVKFTQRQEKKLSYPHEMLEVLIKALTTIKTDISQPSCNLSIVKIKKRIKELIGRGNPFLRSNRVTNTLEIQLRKCNSKKEFIELLHTWITNPNDTFAEEWHHS